MDELNILYDHYKSTFDIQLSYLHKRNKYFLITLALLALLLFKAVYGSSFEVIINSYIQKLAGEKISDNVVMDGLILFSILWTCLLYFKIVITVDRGYDYLHQLEEQINSLTKEIRIDREGAFYFRSKTSFSKWTGKIYKYFFPFSLPFICISTTIFNIAQGFEFLEIINVFLSFLIIIVSILFVFRNVGRHTMVEAKE